MSVEGIKVWTVTARHPDHGTTVLGVFSYSPSVEEANALIVDQIQDSIPFGVELDPEDVGYEFDQYSDLAITETILITPGAKKRKTIETCHGCGCKPSDDMTPDCDHPDGCGFYRQEPI